MRLALLADTHYGIRNDSAAFLDNSRVFFDKLFYPYLAAHDIKTVIHLGDVVDRRKYINIQTANRLRLDFLGPLKDNNIDTHIIAGNHDTYFKNTNAVNALRELKMDVKIYDSIAEEVIFDGLKILFIPWMNDTNKEQIHEMIRTTDAQVAMGHLEISGFEMYKGSIVSHGEDRNIFSKFDLVMSGHYHHRSTDGQIFYLGSHAEFTWSDYDDPRGFHIFDTETREITFIENPYKMFRKVWYNDADENFLNKKIDYSQFRNAMVKIIVQEKNNLYWFEKFVEAIEAENPIELQIVEDLLTLNLEDDSIIDEAESTLSIFKKYIETFDSKSVNKVKLENKITELYQEALNLQ